LGILGSIVPAHLQLPVALFGTEDRMDLRGIQDVGGIQSPAEVLPFPAMGLQGPQGDFEIGGQGLEAKGEFPEILFQVPKKFIQGQGGHILRIGFQGFEGTENDFSAVFDGQAALHLGTDLQIVHGKLLVKFVAVQELGQHDIHGGGNRTVPLGVVTDVILELEEIVHVPGGRLFFAGKDDQKKGDGQQLCKSGHTNGVKGSTIVLFPSKIVKNGEDPGLSLCWDARGSPSFDMVGTPLPFNPQGLSNRHLAPKKPGHIRSFGPPFSQSFVKYNRVKITNRYFGTRTRTNQKPLHTLNKLCTVVISICLFSIFNTAHGQDFLVKGKIVDTARDNPLEAATIYAETLRDSVLISYAITDAQGNFVLEGRTSHTRARLGISYNGYRSQSMEVELSALVELGPIALEEQPLELVGVDLIADRVPLTIRKDTLEFNADSFKTRPDATVEDVLKKLPGVEVASDGSITVNGKTVN